MKHIEKIRITSCGLLPLLLLLIAPIQSIQAATDPEVAELREMVLKLAGEVESLKQQLADKEARRDVISPQRPESDPQLTRPVDKPAVAGVSSKYGLSFYGYFKLDAWHDSGLTSHQEIPFWVRPETPTNGGSFDMTAKETRLGMDFSGPTVRNGKVSGKLEMDFYGNINTPSNLSGNHGFQLRSRHAYLNWDFGDWAILAGKTWEPYLIEIPQTLNFGYYNFMGQLGLRKTQLRFTKKVGDLELIGAVIAPVGGVHGADIDGDLQDDGVDSERPVVSGKILYKTPIFTDQPATLGISFVHGEESIDIPVIGSPTDYSAWAVTAAFNVPITNAITWKGSFFKGSNLDGYWGGIGQGINLGLGRGIASQGGWTQLQLKPNSDITFNIGYGQEDPDDDDLSSGGRTYNETFQLNFYYSFDPSLLWGIEYLRQETGYKEGSAAKNNRVHSSLIYKF